MRLRYEYELREILHLGQPHHPKGVTVVFGGQAGSEGKGAIAGYLARQYNWAVAASTFMPNAGHTWISPRGDEVVVSQLPIGFVSTSVDNLVLGASSVIDYEQFRKELELYDGEYGITERLHIHPRAQVMLPEYREWEKENLRYIASTGKGCGAAIAAKARREQGVMLAKDHGMLAGFVRDDMDLWLNQIVDGGAGILAEQSQGFDLDINHGHSYPYCTSRQCTPSQICADLGVDARFVSNSIAVIRTKPIRVGNVPDGYSGDYGSEELNWDQVSHEAGRSVEETTTVTKRVRRVFDFDYDRINVMSQICRPTHVALTFADYIDPDIFEKTMDDYEEVQRSLVKFSEKMSQFNYKVHRALRRSTFNPKIKLMKTGPADDHIINLGLDLI